MNIRQAKEEFIHAWGKLGSEWGINRTMAQIHALLLVSERSLSTEEIMDQLNISRGNANMNIRDLLNWNLIYKDLVAGDRKEYFKAEKDIWEVAKRIARERKRREIEPVIRELKSLQQVEGSSAEVKQFVSTMKNIHSFATKMDKSVETMLRAEETWFFGAIMKLLK
jgi:DNA-binding transcriptional regulator GbsR (MarR family)